eukprot:COSAG04_NODE_323_length_16882_cov_5.975627_12_plen_84_part_00
MTLGVWFVSSSVVVATNTRVCFRCLQLVMEEVVAVGREASGGELQCRADPAQASHHTKSNSFHGDTSNLGLNVRWLVSSSVLD